MKRILITGANSYIGTSFEMYMEQFGEEYQIDTISLRDDLWKKTDFSKYDSLIHLAAIVHVKEKNEDLYYKINRDLAYETAKKAKEEGVKQFIFFSSMSVFGVDSGIISEKTIPNPKTPYGKSKLAAEELISELGSSDFKVCILRPPMIYGKESKGNYSLLVKYSKLFYFFPDSRNKRSMISIDNLLVFIKLLIDDKVSGFFHPQNKEYVNTAIMMKLIRKKINKKTVLLPIKRLKTVQQSMIQKIFGNLIYESNFADYVPKELEKVFDDTI